jgi:hypothetical protein
MTGEDTDVKTTQFRGSDETLAGSFRKNHVRIADDSPPETPTGRPEFKKRCGDHPHSFTHYGCRTVALLPIGLDLHDLRRLRSLYEIQPELSLCLYPMAGTCTWTAITIHRNCMFLRGGGSGSLRADKPGPIVGLFGQKPL